ncbi:hypothetical protein [Streptomyces uncialis]
MLVFGSDLEMIFAISCNVLEVDEHGRTFNYGDAEYLAAQGSADAVTLRVPGGATVRSVGDRASLKSGLTAIEPACDRGQHAARPEPLAHFR